MEMMNQLVMRTALDCYRQNYIIENNKYFFTGFILHSNAHRNPFYTLLECEPFEVNNDQIRSNTTLKHAATVKSIMHLCLDETYTDFLKSPKVKYYFEDYFNAYNCETSVLDLYKLADLLKIQQISNFHISGRKFGTTYYSLTQNGIMVDCKIDPFNFCKNKLTTTIANIKNNVNIMNESNITGYWNILSKFSVPSISSNIVVSESHLAKLKQISKVKFKNIEITDNDKNTIKRLISSINESLYPPNNYNFEYKVTFKGLTLIVPTWKKTERNGIMLPGIKKRLVLCDTNLVAFLTYLKSINMFDSAISKLESIKLTIT
jgi:hypothetical protein